MTAERAARSALWSLAAFSAASLVMVRLHAFSVPAALLAGVAAGAASLARGGDGSPRRGGRAWRVALVAVAAIPLVVAVTRRAEPILGQSDAGVYVGMGALLARTGSVWSQDPPVARLDVALRAPFVTAARARVGQHEWNLGSLMDPGFHLEDGVVKPQFPPLFPCLLAAAMAIGGLGGALLLPAMAASFATLLAGSVAARAFGAPAGLAAASIMALSPMELWFAREALAATALQLVLLAVLYCLAVWEEEKTAGMPVLAGILSGLGLALHVTMVVYVPGLLAWASLRRSRGFLVAFVPSAVASVLIDVWATPAYMEGTVRQVLVFLPAALRPPRVAMGLLLSVGVACLLAPPLLARIPPRRLSSAARAMLLGYVGWLLLLRPPAPFSVTRHSEDATNVLQLAWYTGPLCLAAALAGACHALRAGARRLELLVLLVLLADPILLLHNNLIPNVHPWMLKRYVVGTLPCLAILAAGVLAASPGPPFWRAVMAAVLAAWPLAGNPAMATFPSLRGARSLVEGISRELPAGAPVMLQGGASALGAPLWLLHGHPALVLWGDGPAEQLAARSALASLGLRGPSPWVLSDAPGGFGAAPSRPVSVDLATLRQVKDGRAGEVERFQATLFATAVPALSREVPSTVDVGGVDFGLVSGVFVPETAADGTTYRWTSPAFHVTVARGGDTLCLRLSGWRPGPDAPRLVITANGHLLGADLAVASGFDEIALPLPPGTGTPLTIRGRVGGFVPALATDSPDARELGLMLDGVRCD